MRILVTLFTFLLPFVTQAQQRIKDPNPAPKPAPLPSPLPSPSQVPLLTISKGHAENIASVIMSPDNKYIISGGWDKAVILWEASTGKELLTLTGYPSWIRSLAITPDGSKLFSGCSKELRVNDLKAGGKELFRSADFTSEIASIAVSPDGKQAAAVGQDKDKDGYSIYKVNIYNTSPVKLIKTVMGQGFAKKINFMPDGELLVLTLRTVQHINVNAGAVTKIDEFDSDDLSIISPNGKYVIADSYDMKVQKDTDAASDDVGKSTERGAATVMVYDRLTQKLLHTFNGQSASIKSLAFSPDSKYMVTGADDNTVYIYDLATMAYDHQLKDKMSNTYAINFSPDGSKVISGNADELIRVWNFSDRKLVKKLGGEANQIFGMEISPSGKSMTVVGGAVNVFDLKRGALSASHQANASYATAYSADDKYLAAAKFDNKLTIWNTATQQPIPGFSETNSYHLVAFTPDSKKVVAAAKSKIPAELVVRSVSDGVILHKIVLPSEIYDMQINADGSAVLVACLKDSKIFTLDIITGALKEEYAPFDMDSKNLHVNKMIFNKDGSEMLIAKSYGYINWYNTASKVMSKGDALQAHRVNDMLLMPGTNEVITAGGEAAFTDSSIRFSDFTTHKQTRVLYVPESSITQLAITPSGKFLFAATYDRRVYIFNLTTNKIVASMAFFGADDWVIADAEGRFDGTQGGFKKMYYVKDLQVIPLESAFEKFYTPALLARILDGENFAPTPININKLKAAPMVQIGYTEVGRNLFVEDDITVKQTKNGQAKIEVKATCPGDAVTEIRLYQNGKLIEGTRNLTVEDDQELQQNRSKSFLIALIPGENIFKTVALNTQRTESKPAIISIVYTPSQGDVPITSDVKLHMLIVGINNYKNPKYNLNYAKADAEAFKSAIGSGSKGLFSATSIIYLSNEEATQTRISEALQKIKGDASPQDLFIFYFAGHGVVNDKKDFYLVPYDVTQLYGNDDALAQKGFSAAELQQWSKEIKAQKQLFILDACQSAGALEKVVGSRGAAEEKAIAQLARSTGTQWLTASGSEQFAAEFAELGHGSFTYCILQALGGAANTGSQLTVKQLDAYLQSNVPVITAKYKGTPQYPASFSYGNDFPIYIFK